MRRKILSVCGCLITLAAQLLPVMIARDSIGDIVIRGFNTAEFSAFGWILLVIPAVFAAIPWLPSKKTATAVWIAVTAATVAAFIGAYSAAAGWIADINCTRVLGIGSVLCPMAYAGLSAAVLVSVMGQKTIIMQLKGEITDMSAQTTDFLISDGVLLKYYGDESTVTVPEGVKYISSLVFEGKRVEKVILPEGLVYIGHAAFKDCKKLKTVTIPSTLERICLWAFDGCTSFREMVGFRRDIKLEREAFRGTSWETEFPDVFGIDGEFVDVLDFAEK